MKKYALILVIILLLGTILYSYKPLLTTIGADSSYSGGPSSSSWSSSGSSSSKKSTLHFDKPEKMKWWEFSLMELFYTAFFTLFGISVVELQLQKQKKYHILNIIINIVRFLISVLIEVTVFAKLVHINVYCMSIIIGGFSIVEEIDIIKSIKKAKKEKEQAQEEVTKIFLPMNIDNYEISQELYQIFIDVQKAWMDFDYEKLKELCSDELYNSYKQDLEILKLKNGRNIMHSFKPIVMYINKITRQDKTLEIEFYLKVKFTDYVINTQTNEVIRGNKNERIINNYCLVYQKQDFYTDKCPSCGETIPAKSNTTCPSCNSIIINNTNKFVLVHKERI